MRESVIPRSTFFFLQPFNMVALRGTQLCAEQQHSSKLPTQICYSWLIILIVLGIFRFVGIIVYTMHPPPSNFNISHNSYSINVLLSLVVCILAPYLVYKQCTRRSEWSDVAKVIGLSVVLYLIEMIIAMCTLNSSYDGDDLNHSNSNVVRPKKRRSRDIS